MALLYALKVIYKIQSGKYALNVFYVPSTVGESRGYQNGDYHLPWHPVCVLLLSNDVTLKMSLDYLSLSSYCVYLFFYLIFLSFFLYFLLTGFSFAFFLFFFFLFLPFFLFGSYYGKWRFWSYILCKVSYKCNIICSYQSWCCKG